MLQRATRTQIVFHTDGAPLGIAHELTPVQNNRTLQNAIKGLGFLILHRESSEVSRTFQSIDMGDIGADSGSVCLTCISWTSSCRTMSRFRPFSF